MNWIHSRYITEINPLNSKYMCIIFKNSIHVAKKRHFPVTDINFLMLFQEIIPAYSENRMKFSVCGRSGWRVYHSYR